MESTLKCTQIKLKIRDTLIVNASGGPLTNDTTLWSTNILDFGVPSGFADTLPFGYTWYVEG